MNRLLIHEWDTTNSNVLFNLPGTLGAPFMNRFLIHEWDTTNSNVLFNSLRKLGVPGPWHLGTGDRTNGGPDFRTGDSTTIM
jgi:hypothetical protein